MTGLMKVRHAVALAACLPVLALGACGGDDETTTTSTTTTPATGATGETDSTTGEATVPEGGDITAQLETVLQEQGGFTEEQAQCVAPKVSDEVETPEELNTQKGVQTLIDASIQAVIECGGPTP